MKRRIFGILGAVLLAGLGTYALISYVESAKDEAVAEEELVDVYVLSQAVSQGTPAGQLKSALRSVQVPAKVVPQDAVTDLDDLDDELVAAVDLAEGEQLLASRLVTAQESRDAKVPPGLQELTVSLDPERAVGGNLTGGDTVGVVLSFDPFEAEVASATPQPQPDETTSKKTPNMTHLTFHKVLVTRVQFDENGQPDSSDDTNEGDDGTTADEGVGTSPRGGLLVTLALDSAQVEQVVFAAEFGHIWLTAEGADADESGTRIVTLGEVYQPAVPR